MPDKDKVKEHKPVTDTEADPPPGPGGSADTAADPPPGPGGDNAGDQ